MDRPQIQNKNHAHTSSTPWRNGKREIFKCKELYNAECRFCLFWCLCVVSMCVRACVRVWRILLLVEFMVHNGQVILPFKDPRELVLHPTAGAICLKETCDTDKVDLFSLLIVAL